jgi:hypothetical protein
MCTIILYLSWRAWLRQQEHRKHWSSFPSEFRKQHHLIIQWKPLSCGHIKTNICLLFFINNLKITLVRKMRFYFLWSSKFVDVSGNWNSQRCKKGRILHFSTVKQDIKIFVNTVIIFSHLLRLLFSYYRIVLILFSEFNCHIFLIASWKLQVGLSSVNSFINLKIEQNRQNRPEHILVW